MIPYLPLNAITASFGSAIGQAVQQVVKSGRYLHGEQVDAFEREFASFLGCRQVVGVANGLDALTLSLMAMKLRFGWAGGDEVIVPDLTFMATAEAVVRAGLTPVWADVDADALLSVESAETLLSPRTRAVIPVHLYGAAADMARLTAWADAHGLKVLEDAAQAHGAVSGGRHVGAWGTMAAFSFYPGKNLGALGDGGAIATDDGELAHVARVLANYGAERKYVHTLMGMNSRLDEIQAAVLRVKLRRLDSDNACRRHVAALYARLITNPAVAKPYAGRTDGSVFHIYPLRSSRRDALQAHLLESSVETLIHYPLTISEQPAFDYLRSIRPASTPHASEWAKTELSLPMHPLMKEKEVRTVCEAINRFELD